MKLFNTYLNFILRFLWLYSLMIFAKSKLSAKIDSASKTGFMNRLSRPLWAIGCFCTKVKSEVKVKPRPGSAESTWMHPRPSKCTEEKRWNSSDWQSVPNLNPCNNSREAWRQRGRRDGGCGCSRRVSRGFRSSDWGCPAFHPYSSPVRCSAINEIGLMRAGCHAFILGTITIWKANEAEVWQVLEFLVW